MKISIFSFLTFFCAVALLSISGWKTSGQTAAVNVALKENNPKVTAMQSSAAVWKGDNNGQPFEKVGGPATKAIDNIKTGNLNLWEETIVETTDKDGWFEVDLGASYNIDEIVIHPRNDTCCKEGFKPTLIVTDYPINKPNVMAMTDAAKIEFSSNFVKRFDTPIMNREKVEVKKIGRYVRLQIIGDGRIELAEIEIFGKPAPATYAPIASKAWDGVPILPFDPNFPNFLGNTQATNPAYYGALQGSPKIVVVKNSATSFDVAYQDLYGDGKKIMINTYEKSGANFVKKASEEFKKGLGTFAGFAKDADQNRYIFTSEPLKDYVNPVKAEVYKIPIGGSPQLLWEAQYFEPGNTSLTNGIKGFMIGYFEGTSRLVTAGNSLLITTNIQPTHPYQVILDTKDIKNANKDRAFFESMNHHNFGQRAFYDGKDFVIMENRDHDVTVSLTKLSPDKPLPLIDETLSAEQIAKMTDQQKWDGHPGPFTKRLYSVYSHTNFANNTYTELGNVEKGFGDNGYLVLFASERDWTYKTEGYSHRVGNWAPRILSSRDIGLVHVKKDFEKEKANWVDTAGNLSMCPNTVDNSSLVNSTGEKTTINYRSSEDGWDWAGTYNSQGPCKNNLGKDRTLVTKGVKWVTNLGNKKKAGETEEFTSVNHPKLVRIAQNKYVAVWEEWKATLGQPKSKYVTTKAALITLSAAANGEVNIESTSASKDLGKIRLMPGDDAFEFDGKAAWAVGDSAKNKLMFYTVDGSLNLSSYALEL